MTRVWMVALLTLGLLAAPLAVGAQPAGKVPHVGFLSWGACPRRDSVFGIALRDLGYTWG
jgi:hypothetical protein